MPSACAPPIGAWINRPRRRQRRRLALCRLNRERAAGLLGFEGVAAHLRDAMWQAGVAIEVAAELVILVTPLDRLAEDLYLFATEGSSAT